MHIFVFWIWMSPLSSALSVLWQISLLVEELRNVKRRAGYPDCLCNTSGVWLLDEQSKEDSARGKFWKCSWTIFRIRPCGCYGWTSQAGRRTRRECLCFDGRGRWRSRGLADNLVQQRGRLLLPATRVQLVVHASESEVVVHRY